MGELEPVGEILPRVLRGIGALRGAGVRILIAGPPVSQRRPQFRRWASKDGRTGVVAYNPAHYEKWKAHARLAVQEAMGERAPLQGAVYLSFCAFLPIPLSFSKRKRAAALAGDLRPASAPDLDHLIGAAMDALSGIAIRDDRCVVAINAEKWYGDRPRVEMVVSHLAPAPVATPSNPKQLALP